MSGLFPERAPNLEAAIRDLASPRPASRRAAAEALGDVRDEEQIPRVREALVRATNDLRPDVRAAAVLSLGDIGGADATKAISLCLDDGNSEVRQTAAVALGTLGDKSAVPALIAAISRGPADLRFQAVTSLAEVDANAAREPLLEVLHQDEDAEVLAATALALGAIGEKRAAERLAQLIPEHGPRTAFDMAYALADLGDTRAIETLGPYASDPTFGWDAIVSLEKLGEKAATRDAVLEPITALLGHSRLDPALRLRAAAASLKLTAAPSDAESPAARILAEGLRARKLEHRGLAVELLAEVGGDWAIAPLTDLKSRWAGRRLRDEIDEALSRLRPS